MMKSVVFVLVMMLPTSWPMAQSVGEAPAQDVLVQKSTDFSQQTIQSFIKVSHQIALLKQEYPAMGDFSSAMMLENKQKIIRVIEDSTAFPKIEKILQPSVFKDLTELFDFSERILAMSYWRKINSSEGADPFQIVKILEITLMNLKANKTSESLIEQAEKTLERQKTQAKVVRTVLSQLSEEDKRFIAENEQWLDELF